MNLFMPLLHGLSSSIILLTGVFLLGLTAFPRFIFDRTNITCAPFFCGAALLSLVSWYGIQWNVPIIFIFKILFAFLCIMMLARLRQPSFRLLVKSIFFAKSTWIGVSIFAFFYGLIAIIITQPIDKNHLPILSFGNNDIFSYLNNARHLLHLGPSNIAGLSSYTQSGNYFQTPATFYFISLFSVFYQYDVMATAMPVIYTSMALIGLMIIRYCRNVYGLSNRISTSIAAVIISCPFYRYIGTQYFLSTLMGMLPLLGVLTDTAQWDFSKTKKGFSRFFCMSLPYYIFLFYIYSVIFFSSIVVVWGLMLLILGIEWVKHHANRQNFQSFTILNKALFWSATLFASIGIVFLFDPIHAKSFLNLFLDYGGAEQQGWPLHWISPFSRLGIFGNMEIHTPKLMIIWMSVFVALIIGLIFALIRKNTKKITPGEQALFILAIIAFFTYDVYFYISDANHQYQPWKFASYYTLPLAGAIWAMMIKIIREPKNKLWASRITIAVFIFLVSGNIYHACYHRSNIQTFSAKYRDLALLDRIDAPAIWVNMATYSSTFLPPYFIQHKKLYLLSKSYYTSMILNPQKISHQWPLFIEQPTSACEKISPKKGMKIGKVGCLYFTNSYHAMLNEHYQNDRSDHLSP